MVARAIKPDYGLSSHVAPLGLTFYTGSSFPPMFRGGAFVGEHGSWNRNQLNGYRVVFIRFANGKPVGKPIDFVRGFVDDVRLGMSEREAEIHAAFADGYTLDDDLYPEGRQH